ncbi:MAG: TetR/AcrR family transcriptional regulator [Alphaproteobacteria bacterium]|nr:TetR/AcrR family transcriptional regulator [Alphaproteobacteria bacterium]
MELPQDVRSRILEAAEARFRQFGFGKTTMAEIAQDCDMSAGNLYRYFQNKEDLGAAISARCMSEREEHGRMLVRDTELGAAERLEQLILGLACDVHEMATENKMIDELVALISKKRMDMVHQHLGTITALFAEVIARGNETGEFDVDDVPEAARALLKASLALLYPPLVAMSSAEEIRADARRVSRLFVRGLARR